MTIHLRKLHATDARQSDDRVLERICRDTTNQLAEEVKPLRWPLVIKPNSTNQGD